MTDFYCHTLVFANVTAVATACVSGGCGVRGVGGGGADVGDDGSGGGVRGVSGGTELRLVSTQ